MHAWRDVSALLGLCLVTIAVGASAANSIARSGDAPVNIYAKLTGTSGEPLIEVGGTQDADPSTSDGYAITGYLRRVPCSGRAYRFAIAANLGTAYSNYEATFVLRLVSGQRIPCGRSLPQELGRRYVRIHIYAKDSTPSDAAIVINGRRINRTAIQGSLLTRTLVCQPALFRAKFSLPSGSVSLLYDMSFTKVTANGRSCS